MKEQSKKQKIRFIILETCMGHNSLRAAVISVHCVYNLHGQEEMHVYRLLESQSWAHKGEVSRSWSQVLEETRQAGFYQRST